MTKTKDSKKPDSQAAENVEKNTSNFSVENLENKGNENENESTGEETAKEIVTPEVEKYAPILASVITHLNNGEKFIVSGGREPVYFKGESSALKYAYKNHISLENVGSCEIVAGQLLEKITGFKAIQMVKMLRKLIKSEAAVTEETAEETAE